MEVPKTPLEDDWKAIEAAEPEEQRERQKRNCAFATEFLVPATLLKERLQVDKLDEEEVDDLAKVVGVSSYVIRPQIDNHLLAHLTLS